MIETAGTQASPASPKPSPTRWYERLKSELPFGNATPGVRHAPLNYFVDYKIGLEKSILDSIKLEMHMRCVQFEWDKRLVRFRIEKVQNHPHIESGYLYELIYNGDGYSYLPQILQAFKSPETKAVGIGLSKAGLVLVHFSGNSQAGFESETWVDPTRNKDELEKVSGIVMLDLKESTTPAKQLYKDNYVPFYIASTLFAMSVLSLPLAAMFKYVWLDQSKIMIDKEYYTQDRYMPVQTIRNVTDPSQFSESERILAIRYSTARGWHIAVEQRQEDGQLVRMEKKIAKDGSLSPAVESIMENPALMGIPPKKVAPANTGKGGKRTAQAKSGAQKKNAEKAIPKG